MSLATSTRSIILALGLLLAPAWALAMADSETALDNSDRIAISLLSAMKASDYASAYRMFDSRMQAEVSKEKLRAVWSAQVGALGALVSWTFTRRSQSQGLDLRLALLKFEKGELQASIAVHQDTQEIAGFLLKPAPAAAKPAPPAPYVRPSEFRPVDVSFGTAPMILGGTLTVPAGLGPFPGVVLVHGSGPHDRDETVGANKVFKDLAEGLASRGIEVLRYDKRTFVYGSKLGDSISVDDEVIADAVAAVAALRERPEIDPHRIFVVGHSLGALLAPEIAQRSAPVAGVVLLAPPGRPIWDVTLSQMRYLGMPASQLADAERQVALLRSGTLGAERFLGAPQSYWRDLASRDGIAAAKKLGKPVLLLRGDRDYQVIEEDTAAWRKGLGDAQGIEIATIPGANHLFIAGTGKPGPREYETPGHVDGRVIDKLSAFLLTAK